METFTPSDAPGRMEHNLSWRSVKSAIIHVVPGMMVGAMPILAVWLRMPPMYLLTFCVTALALSWGFYRYQRWEASRIQDWSFIQWGEFVAGAFIGTGTAILAPVLLTALS